MVTIPKLKDKDPTLEAMFQAEENEQNRVPRNYLGASLIGEPCARKIWYQYNGYEQGKTSYIGLYAAECGHIAEDITAKRLRKVNGVKLWTHNTSGEQYGWESMGGKFQGHYDGVIEGILQAPKTPHVWEHKDKNHKKFSEFQNTKRKFGEKLTLKNWDIVYYAQAQVNMHYGDFSRHYLTVSYAGARDYDSCRTEYSKEDAAFYIDRAEKIIEAKSPPPKINDKPDFFLCRFCNFRNICHNENSKTISGSQHQGAFRIPF